MYIVSDSCSFDHIDDYSCFAFKGFLVFLLNSDLRIGSLMFEEDDIVVLFYHSRDRFYIDTYDNVILRLSSGCFYFHSFYLASNVSTFAFVDIFEYLPEKTETLKKIIKDNEEKIREKNKREEKEKPLSIIAQISRIVRRGAKNK